MFPFDQAALPQLTTRRAFLGVDFQNDFTSEDGALAALDPPGYVQRAAQLATAFREVGDIIWVRTAFDSRRSADAEQILVSDEVPDSTATPTPASRKPLLSSLNARPSRRRVSAALEAAREAVLPPDHEAYLSHDEPSCVTSPDSQGSQWHAQIKASMKDGDVVLTKTHYSAFNATRLLHVLRAKMVMEVFVCGSLANVGVLATAMDAAGHGISITVVEDCCGYRSEGRQRQAMKNLVEYTGCEVTSMKEVLKSLNLAAPKDNATGNGTISDGVSEDRACSGTSAIEPPDLVQSMSSLRIDSRTPISSDIGQPSQPQLPNGAAGDPSTTSGSLPTEHDGNATTPAKSVASEQPIEPANKSTAAALVDTSTLVKLTTTKAISEDQTSSSNRGLCQGDTDIIEHLLPPELEKGIFEKLCDEIAWQRMSHQGGEVPRLVAVQGQVDADGSIPVYRHPSDESPPLLPFSATVLAIKDATEARLGHPLNHVLIQYYRDGKDYISEHSDKTLDIVRDSYIANVSFGAERVMVLRTKRSNKDPSSIDGVPPVEGAKRKVERVRLPHNSLCRMGLQTNMKWLHAIRQDKRAEKEKSPSELAFSGGRISLTFRRIGTFLDQDRTLIWGQGATGKSSAEAGPVANGMGPEAVDMLKAFGAENHMSDFDWEAYYGKGFDVLHMSSSPRLFTCNDALVNMRLELMLAELDISFSRGSLDPPASVSAAMAVKFIDNNPARSVVKGDVAIMLYLESVYNRHKDGTAAEDRASFASLYSNFQQALELANIVQSLQKQGGGEGLDQSLIRPHLVEWERIAANSEGSFLSGKRPSLADFVAWPVLHHMTRAGEENLFKGMHRLEKYYKLYGSIDSTKKIGEKLQASEH